MSAAKKLPPTALLVPKTGPLAALGRSMERAALLAQGDNDSNALIVFDTGDTAEGAAAAASQARRRGAGIILGPVRSNSVPAVVSAAGGIPVVTFGNDAALRESGAFMLGITARQTVATVMRYAANRGLRRIAVGEAPDAWGQQVIQAARDEGQALGIAIATFAAQNGIPKSFAGSADGYPDGILIADESALVRLMPEATQIGIQPLGAFAELNLSPPQLSALGGAWLAAPDPERFSVFARAFEQRVGTRPGLISGLAYDAAMAAKRMRMSGAIDRSAVLSGEGFDGVCGRFRFREDGSAARDMVVLEITPSGIRTVYPTA